MSYGSSFIQFEANGRISQKFSRQNIRRDHHSPERVQTQKVVHYEKEFDVNITRVNNNADKSSVRESMLAYSKKMRSIQDSRYGGNEHKDDPLFVRAKHIPKYPNRQPKKRRPMSFDELLGRDRDVKVDRPNGAKPRPSSEKTKPVHDKVNTVNDIHLPLLSERLRKPNKTVQVSLVSASDLYDIVDFSLRTKGTRNDSLNLLKLEQKFTNDRHQKSNRKSKKSVDTYDAVIPDGSFDSTEHQNNSRQTGDRNSHSEYHNSYDNSEDLTEDFYKDVFTLDKKDPNPIQVKPRLSSSSLKMSPLSINDPIRQRPRRAKRMKLLDSGLGDIPEDNVVEVDNSNHNDRRENVRVISPPPQRTSHRNIEQPHAGLDVIQESVERVSFQENSGSPSKDFRQEHDRRPDHELKDQTSSSTSKYHRQANIDAPYQSTEYRGLFPPIDDAKSTKKLIRDDGDVRIEVTQCPPKHEDGVSAKVKAQKRFKRLIYLRDGAR